MESARLFEMLPLATAAFTAASQNTSIGKEGENSMQMKPKKI